MPTNAASHVHSPRCALQFVRDLHSHWEDSEIGVKAKHLSRSIFRFGLQIEAEGLGKMAVASGYQPIGLPQLVVQHAKVTIPPQPTW